MDLETLCPGHRVILYLVLGCVKAVQGYDVLSKTYTIISSKAMQGYAWLCKAVLKISKVDLNLGTIL